jgi:hypothetical protein
MTITDEMVERVAREVVGDDTASVRTWQAEPLGGGMAGAIGSGGGIWRVRGTMISGSRQGEWSVVVKVLARTEVEFGGIRPDREDPRGFDYWRREADAYASGLLTDREEGLLAPRCYAIDEERDTCVLWLEDVPDEGPGAWPLERYGLAARHLGRFDGGYLGEQAAPDLPWLSRGRVHDWLALGGPVIETMSTVRREGLLATWLSDDSVARIERLWAARERLVDALGALPVTLCHHDAHRRNLGSRHEAGEDRTVAFDWQLFGTGHLGEEAAPIVTVPLQFLDVPMSQAHELEAMVLEGFIEGLRDTGWHGTDEEVRLGFLIGATLMLGLGGTGIWFRAMEDVANQTLAEAVIGRPLEEIGAQWSRLQPYLLDLGDEALRILGH